MVKIALTGGIACGKSTLAKFLRELGIRLLDADDVVHELEGVGGDAVSEIKSAFGAEVIAEDGSVDRARLADMVFFNPRARKVLEGILFPRVRARLLSFVEEATSNLAIVVIPLLFESHWEGDYDIILCVASPAEVQIDRMMRTRGYSREQAEARLSAQMSVAEKAARADFVVVNDSTTEHLHDEACRLFAWLKERTGNEHRRTRSTSGVVVPR
ncbi:MAG: dephospho-CoA kinase [Kiritimatiellia bacterium]